MKIQTFNKLVLASWVIIIIGLAYSFNNLFNSYDNLEKNSKEISHLNQNITDFLILSGELIAFPREQSNSKWVLKHKIIQQNIKEIINSGNCDNKQLCNNLLKLNKKVLSIFNDYVKYSNQSLKKDTLTPFIKIQASKLFSISYEMNKTAFLMKEQNRINKEAIENRIKNKIIYMIVLFVAFLLITYLFIWSKIVLPITSVSKQLNTNKDLEDIKLIEYKHGDEMGVFARAFNNLVEKRIAWEKELASSKHLINVQKNELEIVFDNVKDGIAILDLNLMFLKFNRAYVDMTGFSKNELLQRSCMDLTAPEDKQRTKEALEIVFEKGHIRNFEKACILKNNKRILTNITITLLPSKDKLLITTKDITTLKLLEDQTKMASMGEMIGNIAHQWRQPLSVISTIATGMKFQKELGDLPDEQFYKNCELINTNVQFLSKTIEDFRNFIREDKNKRVFDLKNSIKQFLNLIEGSLKQNYITLKLDIEEEIELEGYENELIQCYMNIFNNSKDALLQNQEEDRYFYISIKKIDNKAVILFKDNANGIDEKILDRIFEPYFTTKHKLNGTGLGLHMTYNMIVNGMKGSILGYNVQFEEEGKKYKGAQFEISLPLEN